MNYKLEGTIKKYRFKFIVILILWLILTIVFVVPITYALCKAKAYGVGFDGVIKFFSEGIGNPFKAISVLAVNKFTGRLYSNIFIFTLVYLIFFLIGFLKSAPKSRYENIEHGSSDWSEHGEQYRILNKKGGIVLAENNYLPVDKVGNVNVLVVGRIRFW